MGWPAICKCKWAMIPFALEGTVPLPVAEGLRQYEVLPAMEPPLRVQFQSVTPSPGSPAELLLQAILHEYVDWARTEGTVDIAMIGRRIKTETGRNIFLDCIGFIVRKLRIKAFSRVESFRFVEIVLHQICKVTEPEHTNGRVVPGQDGRRRKKPPSIS